MKKNSFTLIELLAVITIISIIMIISLPELLGQLKESKENSLEKTKEIITSAARNYVIDYNITFPNSISVQTLCDYNYIDCPIKNPIDDTNLLGYVIANTKYDYIYYNNSEAKVITNMLTNSSFTDSTDWFTEVGSINTSDKVATAISERQWANVIAQNISSVDATHIYYYSIDKTSTACAFGVFVCFNSSGNFIGQPASDGSTNSDFTRISMRFDDLPADTSNSIFSIQNCATSTNVVSIKEPLLIDLTEAFGAENEPDINWCNKNIDYFDGTTTIYVGS